MFSALSRLPLVLGFEPGMLSIHLRTRARKLRLIPLDGQPRSIKQFLSGSLLLLLLFAALLAGTVVYSPIELNGPDTSNAGRGLLQALILVSLATMIAGSLSATVQSLFLSDEVQFLATMPISFETIFFAKCIDCAKGAIPGGLFLVAVCAGYVLDRTESFSVLFLALPIMLLLAAEAVFLAALVTTAVIRFGPRRHTRISLSSASLLILLATSLSWRPIARYGASALPADGSDQWSMVGLTPPGWSAAIIASISGQESINWPANFGLLVASTLLTGTAAARLFETTYRRNLERSDLFQHPSTPRRPPAIARAMLHFAPTTLLHWVKREWALVGRDFGRLTAALWPFAGSSLVAVIALIQEVHGDGVGFWMSHVPLLAIPWAISTGTAVFAIGAESAGLGLIQSLPVRPWLLIAAKFFAYFLPIAGVSLLIAVAAIAIAPGSQLETLLLLALTVVLSAVFCAVDVGVSAVAPRFGAEQKHRSTSFPARALAVVVGLTAASAIMTGVGLSPVGQSMLDGEAIPMQVSSAPVSWLGLLALGLLLPLASMWLGTSRLVQRLSTV